MSEITDYNLSRRAAASLLQISLRTLDRYISSQRLQSSKQLGRIMLSEKEVKNLMSFRKGIKKRVPLSHVSHEVIVPSPERKKRYLDQDAGRFAAQKIPIDKPDIVGKNVHFDFETGLKQNFAAENSNIFQKLFEDARSELKENQKRLEGANYRVGQLEARLEMYQSNFLPLHEHQKELRLLKAAELETNTLYFNSRLERKDIELKLYTERFNRQVITFLLFLILLLQPFFWWILR